MGSASVFIVIAVVLWGSLLSQAAASCEPWAGKLVSVQGLVEVGRGGKSQWAQVGLNETFCTGDRLRVEALSRAALLLPNQTLMRLDEGTAITFTRVETEKPSFMELLKGAVHFITRIPRSLGIKTPFVNAAVEGTEFLVRVSSVQTEVWIFEGRVRLYNAHGELLLANGQAGLTEAGQVPRRRLRIMPKQAVQWTLYYPPIIDTAQYAVAQSGQGAAIRQALVHYRANDLRGALSRLDEVGPESRDSHYQVLRAGLLLSIGRVEQARSALSQALAQDPQQGDAHALQAIIALVSNDPDRALRLAEQGAGLAPTSPVPEIALSYVHQALFDIDQALVHARRAVQYSARDALAWARLAELRLSLGELDQALAAARQAAALDPRLERTQSVLGFAHLMRIETEAARVAFERAIEYDSAAPLARLGLGLAKIRGGALDEGTREIEVAASLDPEHALIRSYLGKAYFEQKRSALAATEYARAKALDPQDPTPWFYDALLKQSDNRPVQALQALQQAIALNDNRAVYRSRLLLDQDLAARNASLARIYSDLGFGQRALIEGWHSLSADPANPSAHRMLADSYAQRPRHEIARVSELLQSQLLQSLNINALQPQLAEAGLQILEGAGPSALSFNEFNPLFMRDRLALQFNGVVGNNKTYGNDLVVSGLRGPLLISAGQFHYESDGFRENNDLQHDIYNVFVQGAVSPKLNLQAEYRRRDTEQGDLGLNFDVDDFSRDERRNVKQDSLRLGARVSPAKGSDLLLSLVYADRDELLQQSPSVSSTDAQEAYQTEAQYLLRYDNFNATIGGGVARVDFDTRVDFVFFDIEDQGREKYDNAYVYTNVLIPKNMTWTLGVGYDTVEARSRKLDRLNPKLGMQWDLSQDVRLRLAYLETLKREASVVQTLEPTQVAGFNQFFDDANGTKTRRHGVGIDANLASGLLGGLEYSRRDLEVPSSSLQGTVISDRREDLFRAYLYWTPHLQWAVKAEAEYENFSRATSDPSVSIGRNPSDVETWSLPLAVRYFHPSGMFSFFGTTFVRQEIVSSPGSSFKPDKEEFLLLDAGIGWRFKKRLGVLSLQARNILDEKFLYQDLNIQSATNAETPRFVPDRALFLRLTLALH